MTREPIWWAAFFVAYEAFDLWDEPRLTAAIALSYFAAALVVDGVFRGAAFCKHLCPIGNNKRCFCFCPAIATGNDCNLKAFFIEIAGNQANGRGLARSAYGDIANGNDPAGYGKAFKHARLVQPCPAPHGCGVHKGTDSQWKQKQPDRHAGIF